MKATRREFLKIFSIGALATAINPLNTFAGTSRTLDNVLDEIKNKEKAISIFPSNAELRYDLYDLFDEAAGLSSDDKQLKQKASESFKAGVSIDMAKKTVDEILAPQYKSGSIVQVEYDSKKGQSNFDRLVYQKDVKASERMPVLAMFYVNKSAHDSNKDPAKAGSCKREAIILKNLVRKYKGKVKFVVQEWKTDPQWHADYRRGGNNHNNIKTNPSIAMYSPWDVVKGETPNKNNGKVTQVDVLRGGPSGNQHISTQTAICDYWINNNYKTLKPSENVWRFKNKYKLSKVE
jgi:hypothetical protein